MSSRRKLIPGVYVPVFILFMGFAALINFASTPGFETLRTVDVVRLIAAGMCFGAAVASLVMLFVGGHHSN